MMKLSPREVEKLMLHNASFLAQKRLASGSRLNYTEAVALIATQDEDFKCGSWVSAIEYANANGGIVSGCLGDIKNFLKNEKLDQVLETVKSCTLDVLCDLTVTLEQLSDIFPVIGSGDGVGGSGMLDEEK
uniref:Uncharacterized protein n=1 Tax=Tanacetum cinerariifolium TaxID=118510 RepID=A0A699GXJ7_TANCI|nr:hypothetical protein [Tanacetum cinerariifolium]